MLAQGREIAAVLAALAVYRIRIAPFAQEQLRSWRRRATAIADPDQRVLALAAIDEKGSNVEAIAVFAILAPRPRRQQALRAMTALQVAVDYLDSADEQASCGDLAYLRLLFGRFQAEARGLPAFGAVEATLNRAVDRCGEGQRQTHSAERGNRSELEAWARALTAPPHYRWWETAAGASSSVAAHALIAAAADPRISAAEAALIDAAYFPPLGALTVFLDDLVDREADAAAGSHNYLSYYRDAAEAAERLQLAARQGRAAVAQLRYRHRHAAIQAGILGFYLSAPQARSPYATPIRLRLLADAGPAVPPIVAFRGRRRRP